MEALKLNQAAVTLHLRIDKQGSSVWLDKHGGTGGFRTDKVKLNYPGEFLTSIHGYSGHLYGGGPLCVRSLTFVSNERTHGPFGVTLGTFFSLPMAGHKIVGFYGRFLMQPTVRLIEIVKEGK